MSTTVYRIRHFLQREVELGKTHGFDFCYAQPRKINGRQIKINLFYNTKGKTVLF